MKKKLKINRLYFSTKLKFFLLLLVIVSYLYFTFYIFIPAYNRLGWHYPFGWDAPQYLSWIRYIIEKEYIHTLLNHRYPFGTHLIVVILSSLTHIEPSIILIFFPEICLLTYMLGISLLYYKARGNALSAGLVGAIIPYNFVIYYIFSALYQQFAYMSLLPLILYLVSSFVEKTSVYKLISLIITVIIGWWLWPWGFIVTTWILLIPILLRDIKINIKIIFFCLATSLVLGHFIWQFNIYKVPFFEGLEAVSKTRPPYTFSIFLERAFNGSWMLLLFFCGGLLYNLVCLYHENVTSKIITLYTIGIILGIVASPFVEAKYRLTPFIPSYWLIIDFIVYVFLQKIPVLNKKKIKFQFKFFKYRFYSSTKFLFYVIAIILFLSGFAQLYFIEPSTVQRHLWRRWLSVNDTSLISSLQSIKEKISQEEMGENFIIIVPFNYKYKSVDEVMLLNLYVKSFFPNSIMIYYGERSWNVSILIKYLHMNDAYIHPWCAITMDGLTIDSFSVKGYQMVVLILREIFYVDNLPLDCIISLKKNGYGIIKL